MYREVVEGAAADMVAAIIMLAGVIARKNGRLSRPKKELEYFKRERGIIIIPITVEVAVADVVAALVASPLPAREIHLL